MAYDIITDDEINLYAGENVDSSPTAAQKEAMEDQIISRLSGFARVDVNSSYGGWTTAVKKIINEYIAREIAVALIAYNMEGFTSRIEAEDMLNVNIYALRKLEKNFLLDQKWWTFVKGA